MRRRRDYYGDDVKVYKTEAEMCADFIVGLKDGGWTPYPETEGWDILMVHGDGRQIGIQAKLKANVEVLAQAVRGFRYIDYDDEFAKYGYGNGPDYVAVLVPAATNTFFDLASVLRVLVLRPFDMKWGGWKWNELKSLPAWPSHFKRREKLPQYVPDVVPGRPCPIQLTDWKIKAIRVCRTLRHRGYVTVADFKQFGINSQRWVESWIDSDGGKPAKYTIRPGVRLPDENHPKVSAQIDDELGFTKVQV